MPLVFEGVTITAVTVDGASMTEVVCDGTTVWTSGAPSSIAPEAALLLATF
jgi:hypothetical protein